MVQALNVSEESRAVEEESYWRAVVARDASFDGRFFYGVRSTGVFCKPSCPSRRPGREQVVFFFAGEAAEEAGFRPCLRCRPRGGGASAPQAEMVARACRAIEASPDGAPSLTDLGAELAVSPYHLQRTFKRVTGVTPRQYAEAHRLSRFKAGLRRGEELTAAMYEAGYGSSSRLYEKAGAQLGMTPGTYARGGRGMSIVYTIVESTLGRLLVAATERGVCAVSFGEADEEMVAALGREYPNAEISRGEGALSEWVEVVLSLVGGGARQVELPLDLRATAFQLRVWEELRRIPYGSTLSYGELAAAVGRPKAVRAVARACATNPVAVVTPCHRVLRSNGDLGGYRWGVERKRKLLAREGGAEGAEPAD